MLPGWCCIANRHIGARERRQLIPPHVRFQVPFLGPESQLKSGFACAGLCSLDVFSKSEKWLGSPPVPDTGKRTGDTWMADRCQRSYCVGNAGVFRVGSRNRTSMPADTESEEQVTDGNPQKCVQCTPQDSNSN